MEGRIINCTSQNRPAIVTAVKSDIDCANEWCRMSFASTARLIMTSVFEPNQRKGTKKGKTLTGDSAPARAAVA